MFGLLGLFIFVSSVKAPDPYVGLGITPVPITFEAEEESKFRRKYLQLGFPFEFQKISIGEMEGLRVMFVPEVATNMSIFLAQGVLTIEETIPFRAYRSVPSGIFWGFGAGGHLGWIKKKDEYLVNGEPMTEADQLSLAGVAKIYGGPEFIFHEWMKLRLRFGFDILYGRIAPLTLGIGSRNWGLLYFMQAQWEFD